MVKPLSYYVWSNDLGKLMSCFLIYSYLFICLRVKINICVASGHELNGCRCFYPNKCIMGSDLSLMNDRVEFVAAKLSCFKPLKDNMSKIYFPINIFQFQKLY